MDNDVSQVINRTVLIENLLSQVIMNYSSPRKEAFNFFWEVLLDSSVMSLGSKVKAVMALSQEFNFKLDKNAIHQVVSYRNAFAHHATNARPLIKVGKTREEDELHHMLCILKSSGKTEELNRQEALDKFNNSYVNARESLVLFIAKIKESAEGSENTV